MLGEYDVSIETQYGAVKAGSSGFHTAADEQSVDVPAQYLSWDLLRPQVLLHALLW